jgi:hypothetical protein
MVEPLVSDLPFEQEKQVAHGGYYFMYADGLGLGLGLGLDTNSISGHNNRHT